MTGPNPDAPAPPPRRGRLRLLFVALAAAWILARLPSGAVNAACGLPTAWRDVRTVLELDGAKRIARAAGVTPDVLALLRRTLGEDGRLVVYCPYRGTVVELIVRTQFERLKNLLYPTPRDVAFAHEAAELQQWVEARLAGRLVVVDGTQEPTELPVAARFDLLTEQRLGDMRVRYWLLVEGGR